MSNVSGLYSKVLFIILFLSSALNLEDKEYDRLWKDFKEKYRRTYSEYEDELRKYIFVRNVDLIEDHNAEAAMNKHSFTLEINKYADWTYDEKRHLRGYMDIRNRSTEELGKSSSHANKLSSLPEQVDWRKKGYVTPVQDQGICGCCWSFSSVGSLEGLHKRTTGKLVALSEQNLIDCSWKFGNQGCDGGMFNQAFEYVIANNGIDTEESYPYTGKNGHCKFKASEVGAHCRSYVNVPMFSESGLQSACAAVGPISVAIDAASAKFHFYKSGVFYSPECQPFVLDHGVLVVGYGRKDDLDYWIVKNSWGPDWGLDGYILMSRNRDNNCGIATSAMYPTM